MIRGVPAPTAMSFGGGIVMSSNRPAATATNAENAAPRAQWAAALTIVLTVFAVLVVSFVAVATGLV
jgi:hypothetical protein